MKNFYQINLHLNPRTPNPCLRISMVNRHLYANKNDTSGFTLLEIIIVLFLITLITGMSTIFLLNALPSNKLNATARTLSATIRQARTLAQIHNEGKTVFIDLDSRKYGIEGLGSRDIPSEIFIKVTDPMSGEILKGTYKISVHSGGGIEGGTIQLWTLKKAVSIQIDPVLGAVVIK